MAIGWTLLIQRLLTVSLFRSFRFVYSIVQRVYWELNGTACQKREANDPRNYERSIQVFDVLFEHHLCDAQANVIENFLLAHNRFENPQFVIDNEHVTLLTVNKRSAVFGVARDKSMRLWKTEFNSFIRMAQPLFCNQLIVVPLPVFHRMAETIGDPKEELIFLFNTARCGSTLLTQIMEYTGRCVALSEPDTPNYVASKYSREGNTPEVRQLAHDVLRWECRPYPSMQPQPLAVVLKISAPSAIALPLFYELYPKSRNIFMYRDVVKNSKSIYRMAYTLPSLWLAYKLGRLSASVTEAMIDSMGLPGKYFHFRVRNDLELGIITNCCLMKMYLDLRKAGIIDIVGVRYEDLVADPTESIRRILEYCHLPVELTEAGRRGLDVDSQRNSSLAKSIIGGLKEPELTPDAKAISNEHLRNSGLPLIGQECLLEGTITSKKQRE